MAEEKPEDVTDGPLVPNDVVELNRRKVKLRRMHVPGTRTIANGLKLELEHIFGLPNEPRNPYMAFLTDDDHPKTKGGMLSVHNVVRVLGRTNGTQVRWLFDEGSIDALFPRGD